MESKNQNFKLPASYVWSCDRLWYRLGAWLLYRLALCIGWLYCRLALHLKIVNRGILKPYRGKGYFLYGNHTQPFGDVVIPALACAGQRIYTIVSPANLGIPFLGRLLPALGAIPVADNLRQMRQHTETVTKRIREGRSVVIYPEAHVWPYCTQIRPYDDTSFWYPAKLNAPVFSMTATYRKRRFGAKPALVLYLDGPFLPDEGQSLKERQKTLWTKVRSSMQQNSLRSNAEYWIYEKEDEA